MENKANAEYVWKQVDDVVVPRLRLSVSERAVYCHLLRHSRLEGKVRYRFSVASLGRATRLSHEGVRCVVRRLADQGAVRLVRRSRRGHEVDVRVPDEIRAVRVEQMTVSEPARFGWGPRRSGKAGPPGAVGIDDIDFMQTKALRQAIHARERGRCFYCLRRVVPTVRCLDHVVPRAQAGRNSYRNLVSACLECNSQKGEKAAEDFLRWLFRERRLTAGELSGRVEALGALAAGKMRPKVEAMK